MQRQSLTTSHQQINAQEVSEQQLFWKDNTSVLLLSMMLYGMEYTSGPFESAVLSVCNPSVLPTPAYLLWGQSEKRKALILCKHCLSIAKTLACYRQSQIQSMAPYRLLWRKLN